MKKESQTYSMRRSGREEDAFPGGREGGKNIRMTMKVKRGPLGRR